MLDKVVVTILTSVDHHEQAEWMVQRLLEQRLAACVQQVSGASHYRWQGKLECTQEYYLHIKTVVECQDKVVAWLEENHPYETPEIIVLEGRCSSAYGRWLANELN